MQLDNFLTFVQLGFRHILPEGFDHICFIIALFLIANGWRSLLLQVSCFTLAHSVTLGLAAANLIEIPASIVEPLIALSIAAVGVEALISNKPRPWRLPVIFGFGLFHGLGFAQQMQGYLEGADFLTGLVGFNVGVEIGQLAVLAAFGALAFLVHSGLKRFGREGLYKWVLVRPAALIVTGFGVWWLLQRTGVLAAAGV